MTTTPPPLRSDGYADQGQIARAEFDPKVIAYWWIRAMWLQLISFIGIPLIPVWLVIGYAVHQRQFAALSCVLTDRTINIKRGWMFQKQQNIPLDKITDISISEGPVLKALGVSNLSIETAGSTPFFLTGVREPLRFRDTVLQQRDTLTAAGGAGPVAHTAAVPAPAAGPGIDPEVLVEIRDILRRIERRLSDRD